MTSLATPWFLLVVLPLVASCQTPVPAGAASDMFILPSDYSGRVLVFYGQPGGQPLETVNGHRVFVIPQSGVLHTQAPPNLEWVELPMYYLDSISSSTQIPTRTDWSEFSAEVVNASLVSTGSFEHPSNDSRIVFGEFYIGTKEQVQEAAEQAELKSAAQAFQP